MGPQFELRTLTLPESSRSSPSSSQTSEHATLRMEMSGFPEGMTHSKPVAMASSRPSQAQAAGDVVEVRFLQQCLSSVMAEIPARDFIPYHLFVY